MFRIGLCGSLPRDRKSSEKPLSVRSSSVPVLRTSSVVTPQPPPISHHLCLTKSDSKTKTYWLKRLRASICRDHTKRTKAARFSESPACDITSLPLEQTQRVAEVTSTLQDQFGHFVAFPIIFFVIHSSIHGSSMFSDMNFIPLIWPCFTATFWSFSRNPFIISITLHAVVTNITIVITHGCLSVCRLSGIGSKINRRRSGSQFGIRRNCSNHSE